MSNNICPVCGASISGQANSVCSFCGHKVQAPSQTDETYNNLKKGYEFGYGSEMGRIHAREDYEAEQKRIERQKQLEANERFEAYKRQEEYGTLKQNSWLIVPFFIALICHVIFVFSDNYMFFVVSLGSYIVLQIGEKSGNSKAMYGETNLRHICTLLGVILWIIYLIKYAIMN